MNSIPLRLIYFLFLVIGFTQCIPEQKEDPGEINANFSDAHLKHIIDLADQQVKDSLYTQLQSKSPTIRYYALKGLAAMKDSTSINQVAVLLNDPVNRIQELAAYTIGMTGSTKGERSLIKAFAYTDSVSARQPSNEWILEALGRCGSQKTLKNIAEVPGYLSRDTALVNGRSKALYRFSLRKMILPQGTKIMLDVATDPSYPPTARLYAAAYLGRTKSLSFDTEQSHKLLTAFTKGTEQEKLFFAQAIGKSTDSTTLLLLRDKIDGINQPRLKATILMALKGLSYNQTKEVAFEMIHSTNPQTYIAASNWIRNNGIAKDVYEYNKMAKDTSITSHARVALLTAGLKYIYRLDSTMLRAINRNLRNEYILSNDPYIQAEALRGLAEYPWNFRFIRDECQKSDYKIIQVAGIESLDQLLRSENYIKSIGSYRKGLKREMAGFFTNAIESGDVGKRAAAAIALRNDDPEFRFYAKDSMLVRRLRAVVNKPPIDIESHNEILKTIAELTGLAYSPIQPTNYHGIEWSEIEDQKSNPKITLSTTQGNIILELFPKEAPATVSNFIKEARRKYYNNKTFHRVVPNFVIQGGCPRGDGYGALDYSIHSEFFPYNYDDAGYFGMASSGIHTESVQFFITHSATPHLDGNYTIFGKVINGMDVVQKIGVGDKILTVGISY